MRSLLFLGMIGVGMAAPVNSILLQHLGYDNVAPTTLERFSNYDTLPGYVRKPVSYEWTQNHRRLPGYSYTPMWKKPQLTCCRYFKKSPTLINSQSYSQHKSKLPGTY